LYVKLKTWRYIMIRKMMIAGVVVATFAAPALAATEFFVAKDAATQKCAVMDTKPDEKAAMAVGTVSYTTKEDAEAAMKAAPECKA
jgi:hypothetical protein